MFTDKYPVTCWGVVDLQVAEATNWEDLVGTWSELTGSWSDLGAKFGLKSLVHGTLDGYPLRHNYNIITRFDTGTELEVNPSYSFTTLLSSLGDPTKLKTARKLWVEHLQLTTNPITMTVKGDATDSQESGTVTPSPGAVFDLTSTFRTFNFTAANLQFEVSGTAPVAIRSFEAEFSITESEERKGS